LPSPRSAQQRDAVGTLSERPDRGTGEENVAVVVEPDGKDVGHAASGVMAAAGVVAPAAGGGSPRSSATAARRSAARSGAVTTAVAMPADRSRATASAAPGIGVTRAASPLYGTSSISVPSRSNRTAAGQGRGPGLASVRRSPARPRSHHAVAANGIATLVQA